MYHGLRLLALLRAYSADELRSLLQAYVKTKPRQAGPQIQCSKKSITISIMTSKRSYNFSVLISSEPVAMPQDIQNACKPIKTNIVCSSSTNLCNQLRNDAPHRSVARLTEECGELLSVHLARTVYVGLGELLPHVIPMHSFVLLQEFGEVVVVKKFTIVQSSSYDGINPFLVDVLVAKHFQSFGEVLTGNFTVHAQRLEEIVYSRQIKFKALWFLCFFVWNLLYQILSLLLHRHLHILGHIFRWWRRRRL
mmetsp:Transcript_2151/g.4035  ORF Transcript_2151/g.4035 Transcript_2151/m.4035 type:complete len:251 (-) Transcript_2151:470-1222(-)